MSRIGRKPIPIPSGVDVKFDGTHVTVKVDSNFKVTSTEDGPR